MKLSLSSSSACASHAAFCTSFKFSEPNFTLIVHFSAYDPSEVPTSLPATVGSTLFLNYMYHLFPVKTLHRCTTCNTGFNVVGIEVKDAEVMVLCSLTSHLLSPPAPLPPGPEHTGENPGSLQIVL